MRLNGKTSFLMLIVGVFSLTLGVGIILLTIAERLVQAVTSVGWISTTSIVAIVISSLLFLFNTRR